MSMLSDVKSDRPDVALSADPEVAFFSPGGGKSDHMLVNLGEKRLAVKIRCSNNNLYRVSPVTMFIDAGQCSNVIVTRLPGAARADKLIVQFTPCAPEDDDIKKVYANVDKSKVSNTVKIGLKMQGEGKERKMSLEQVDDARQ